jgi:RNA polymerase sigma-70 factor, ECF subfamily
MTRDVGDKLPPPQNALGDGGALSADDLQLELVALYSTLRPALLNYVRQMLRSSADAEDIVQAAFLKTFDQAQLSHIENLRSWIYRVAHNLAIDSLRRTSIHDQAVSEWTYRNPQETAVTAEQASINRQAIERALCSLNERERGCLLLRAEGFSYEEIAQVLGTSAKSVSVYLARAVKKVRNPS